MKNKSGLKFASVLVLLVFTGFFAFGQWSTNGSDIYNNNAGNVGITTAGTSFTPSGALHVLHPSASCDNYLEGFNSGTAGDIATLRMSNSFSGDLYGFYFKLIGGDTYGVVSLYDAGAAAWRAFYRFNLTTRQLEYRPGIVALKFSNGGDVIFNNGGNVGIGITNPTNALEVNGSIRTKEVLVENSGWPDFVFSDDYNLPALEEIETFIITNNHLPGVPTASEVEENGLKLGEMNAVLLQKIEEMTLYMIELKKENEDLKVRVSALEK